MERRIISKSEIVYSCRRQDRDYICVVFSGVYALRVLMENRITSKGEIVYNRRRQNMDLI